MIYQLINLFNTEVFWQLLLIFILLKYKVSRNPAIFLIAIRCIEGKLITWHYVILGILILMNWVLQDTKNYDDHIKGKRRIDPDYE